MSYMKQLPHISDLIRLSKLVTHYPCRRDELMRFATMGEFGDDVCEFLLLFPADHVFSSPVDFISQADEVELLINEERDMPPEVLHSPQD